MIKKRFFLLFLTGIMIGTTACTLPFNKDTDVEDTDEVEVISVDVNTDIPNITTMNKSEILSMSAKEVKDSVETYLPSYKEIYKIDTNKTMTDDDWLSLRNIICIQFYGNDTLSTAESADTDNTDENAIYYSPTRKSIENMSTLEFGTYLNGMYTYMYGEDYLKKNNLDFTTYDEKTLQELKKNFINSIPEETTKSK